MNMVSPKLSRRGLVAALTAAPLALAKKKGFDKPLGVQLYTLRNVLPNDADGVLKTVAEIGYKEVEILRKDMAAFDPILKKYGLRAVSGHFETPIFMGEGHETWGLDKSMDVNRAIEEAKKYGLTHMVVPYVRPLDRGGPDYFKRFADNLNKAGEQVTKAGMTLCYHNHAFEFGGKSGERTWDILLERTDPKNLQIELDIFWVATAGEAPTTWIKKLKGRVPLVHLKDRCFGAPTMFDEKVKPEAFCEVGAGTLDFIAVLRACQSAGVKHLFVEQDQTQKEPLASLRLSYTNIRKLVV